MPSAAARESFDKHFTARGSVTLPPAARTRSAATTMSPGAVSRNPKCALGIVDAEREMVSPYVRSGFGGGGDCRPRLT